MAFIGSGFAFASWAARIPQVRDRLELSSAQLGLVLLAIAAGSVLALPLAGPVVTRFGSRRTVAAMAVLFAAALALAALGHLAGVWPLVAGLFLLGLANGAWDVAMNVQGARVEQELGRSIMARFHAGWWDESPYLVTEYVATGSLAAALRGRPHPVPKALRLLVQLGEVVCYLHRQGVVHGNLKPTNVLLAAGGIPRLCDLGAVRADDAAGLAYAAPECVHDPSAEPRPHTDVYGLGVILYELMTGRPPFAGATAREVLDEVLYRDAAPPSGFNSEVMPALDTVCLRCLRKNPWRRFVRAYDLLIVLRELMDDAEGRAAPGPRRSRRLPPGL